MHSLALPLCTAMDAFIFLFNQHSVSELFLVWLSFDPRTAEDYYAGKQLLLSARFSHRNSVCLSVTRVDQSKMVQARITRSLLLAAWKTLVPGTIKLFINSKGVIANEGVK